MRVQDGLKRVREEIEMEGRSNAKDDFSTLDKKVDSSVCSVVCMRAPCVSRVCVCVRVRVCADASGFLVPFPLHTPQSLTRHTCSTGAVEYVLPTNRPPLIRCQGATVHHFYLAPSNKPLLG